jgi:hypothetical protein
VRAVPAPARAAGVRAPGVLLVLTQTERCVRVLALRSRTASERGRFE